MTNLKRPVSTDLNKGFESAQEEAPVRRKSPTTPAVLTPNFQRMVTAKEIVDKEEVKSADSEIRPGPGAAATLKAKERRRSSNKRVSFHEKTEELGDSPSTNDEPLIMRMLRKERAR